MNLVPRNQIFDLDSFFNDFFPSIGTPFLRGKQADSLAGMRVDVHETDDAFEIHADLPGIKKEDIDVRLENDVLTVSASKNTEKEEKKKGKVVYRERSSGMLSRSFHVNPGTTHSDIQANFVDGVLTLSVPKKSALPEEETSKRIEIS